VQAEAEEEEEVEAELAGMGGMRVAQLEVVDVMEAVDSHGGRSIPAGVVAVEVAEAEAAQVRAMMGEGEEVASAGAMAEAGAAGCPSQGWRFL